MSSTSVLFFRHALFIPLCKIRIFSDRHCLFRFAKLELFFMRFLLLLDFYKVLIAFFIVPPPTTISPS